MAFVISTVGVTGGAEKHVFSRLHSTRTIPHVSARRIVQFQTLLGSTYLRSTPSATTNYISTLSLLEARSGTE